MEYTSHGCAVGLACSSCAAAPTTCGADMEVPDMTLSKALCHGIAGINHVVGNVQLEDSDAS